MKLNDYRLQPAIIWLIIALVAMLTPGNNLPSTPAFPHSDKLAHIGIFAVLVFLWCRVGTINGDKKLKKTNLFTNYLVFGFVFAILVEYLQRFVPNRTYDLGDLAANLIGGAVGVICFYILYKRDSILV